MDLEEEAVLVLAARVEDSASVVADVVLGVEDLASGGEGLSMGMGSDTSASEAVGLTSGTLALGLRPAVVELVSGWNFFKKGLNSWASFDS